MEKIFEQRYSSDSLCDVERDIQECFDFTFNPSMENVDPDKGTFIVTVVWVPD